MELEGECHSWAVAVDICTLACYLWCFISVKISKNLKDKAIWLCSTKANPIEAHT